MFETYRMLGEQQEAELVRRAETPARAVTVPSGPSRARCRYGLRAVGAALSYLRSGRATELVRSEVDVMEDARPPSGRKAGAAAPTR